MPVHGERISGFFREMQVREAKVRNPLALVASFSQGDDGKKVVETDGVREIESC